MKTTLTGRKRKLQIKTNKKHSTQKPSKNSPYTLHMTRGFFSDAAYRATFIYTFCSWRWWMAWRKWYVDSFLHGSSDYKDVTYSIFCLLGNRLTYEGNFKRGWRLVHLNVGIAFDWKKLIWSIRARCFSQPYFGMPGIEPRAFCIQNKCSPKHLWPTTYGHYREKGAIFRPRNTNYYFWPVFEDGPQQGSFGSTSVGKFT